MIRINNNKNKFLHYLTTLRYVKLYSYKSTKVLQRKMYNELILELEKNTKKLIKLEQEKVQNNKWIYSILRKLFFYIWLKRIIQYRKIKKIQILKERIIQLNQDINKKKYLTYNYKGVYYYGFQILYGAINKFLLLIAAGLLFHALPQILIATLSFMCLRIYIGGLHYDSYTKCAWVSLTCLITIGLLAKYIPYNYIVNNIIFVTLLCIILKYAPVKHKNRSLTDAKKIRFKYIALILLIVLYSIQLILSINNINIKNCIMYGVLLSGIIALPIFNKSEKREKKGISLNCNK